MTCAVIRNQTVDDLSLREVTLEARFPAPIAGVVTFRQTIDDQASMTYDTQIIVDLFSNDGSPTTEGGNWFLVKGQVIHGLHNLITDSMNIAQCSLGR